MVVDAASLETCSTKGGRAPRRMAVPGPPEDDVGTEVHVDLGFQRHLDVDLVITPKPPACRASRVRLTAPYRALIVLAK